jgi:hypothetical protein
MYNFKVTDIKVAGVFITDHNKMWAVTKNGAVVTRYHYVALSLSLSLSPLTVGDFNARVTQ